MVANAANELDDEGALKDEDDLDEYRIWLLPLEWVLDSIEAGEALDEMEYDYQKQMDEARRIRAAKLAEERRRNGGKSKYGRGERREAELKAKLRREERAMKEEEQKAAMAKAEAEKRIPKVAAKPQVAPPVQG